ncbi:hypothetical protein QE152_g38352 [Popillia japonica]|uniref:Uncharacterized protein n=1 Tax=Popillia japonica TaxID=7064 RepID=A0AAW1HYP3_POPJA
MVVKRRYAVFSGIDSITPANSTQKERGCGELTETTAFMLSLTVPYGDCGSAVVVSRTSIVAVHTSGTDEYVNHLSIRPLHNITVRTLGGITIPFW